MHSSDLADSYEFKYVRKKLGSSGFGSLIILLGKLLKLKNSMDISNEIIRSMLCDEFECTDETLTTFLEIFIKSESIILNGNVISSSLIQTAIDKVNEVSEIKRNARLKGHAKAMDLKESNETIREVTKPSKAVAEFISVEQNKELVEIEENNSIPFAKIYDDKEPLRNGFDDQCYLLIDVFNEMSSDIGRYFEIKKQPNIQEKNAYKAFMFLCNSRVFQYTDYDIVIKTMEKLINKACDKLGNDKKFIMTEVWNGLVDVINESTTNHIVQYAKRSLFTKIHNGQDKGHGTINEFRQLEGIDCKFRQTA
jgi:hypothetical protein